jgi:hypothetical protein
MAAGITVKKRYCVTRHDFYLQHAAETSQVAAFFSDQTENVILPLTPWRRFHIMPSVA